MCNGYLLSIRGFFFIGIFFCHRVTWGENAITDICHSDSMDIFTTGNSGLIVNIHTNGGIGNHALVSCQTTIKIPLDAAKEKTKIKACHYIVTCPNYKKSEICCIPCPFLLIAMNTQSFSTSNLKSLFLCLNAHCAFALFHAIPQSRIPMKAVGLPLP